MVDQVLLASDYSLLISLISGVGCVVTVQTSKDVAELQKSGFPKMYYQTQSNTDLTPSQKS
jgi:hypothetical protein